MENENKITAEIKDPITGKMVTLEANSENELEKKIDDFFDKR